MKQQEIIDELSKAQKIINGLLINARNANLKVDISINNTTCFEGDTGIAIGLDIYSVSPMYSSNGIP